jgi:glycosyltransferase involved in cell wall biosynthesis
MNQLVSIIVPCYNQAEYLSEALETVINQTYVNWECIVVNDGSLDNTKEVTKDWLNKDNRFCYIEIDNKGVSNARNIGIEAAKGTFILPLDADDRISFDYIELALKEFKEDDNLKVVYGKAERFGIIKGLWKLKKFSLKNLAQSNMIYCSALFKKTDWEKVGGYDTKMIHGLEDWEFWIALLKNGGGVKQIGEIVFYYRIKEVSRNKEFNDNQKIELYNYICMKHALFFTAQLGSNIVLNQNILKLEKQIKHLTKSKKNAINVLFKSFFGTK